MLGKTVGKYRIVERLGRGGMGTVYRAVDETLDRDVAIKVLNPDLSDTDVFKRFRGEAVTLARLNHPGIATIYELYRQDDELLMVMEYVRGETVHDLCERLGSVAPPQAAHIAVQVLDALAHAHRAGVVHRDLKPANLMISETGAVKVMDFGIARVLGTEHYTTGGYMMGTPAYMAPEQVLGRDVDARADLYAIGVVLYRLLSGELPFKADTAIAMVQKQVADAPTPIEHFRPDLPVWCSAIVNRALSKVPDDRFQTAEEFRAALLAAERPETLGELPTLATPTPPGLRMDAATISAHGTAPSIAASGANRAPVSGATAPSTSPAPQTSQERTTTVVLGRTHLAALAAIILVLAVGVVALAVAAFRTKAATLTQAPAQAAAEQPAPSGTNAGAPGATAPPAPPAALPAQQGKSATVPPPPDAGLVGKPVATAGEMRGRGDARPAALPSTTTPGSGVSPAASTSPPASADPLTAGRGGRAAAKDTAAASATPAGGLANPAAVPLTFGDIRVIVNDAGKGREREGVLQLGAGELSVLDRAGGKAIVAVPYSALVSAFYSRSKQPKWRDAQGREVVSKIDLGKLGFLKSDRHWLILATTGEPLILRLEDSSLRTVVPAVEQRAGIKVQR